MGIEVQKRGGINMVHLESIEGEKFEDIDIGNLDRAKGTRQKSIFWNGKKYGSVTDIAKEAGFNEEQTSQFRRYIYQYHNIDKALARVYFDKPALDILDFDNRLEKALDEYEYYIDGAGANLSYINKNKLRKYTEKYRNFKVALEALKKETQTAKEVKAEKKAKAKKETEAEKRTVKKPVKDINIDDDASKNKKTRGALKLKDRMIDGVLQPYTRQDRKVKLVLDCIKLTMQIDQSYSEDDYLYKLYFISNTNKFSHDAFLLQTKREIHESYIELYSQESINDKCEKIKANLSFIDEGILRVAELLARSMEQDELYDYSFYTRCLDMAAENFKWAISSKNQAYKDIDETYQMNLFNKRLYDNDSDVRSILRRNYKDDTRAVRTYLDRTIDYTPQIVKDISGRVIRAYVNNGKQDQDIDKLIENIHTRVKNYMELHRNDLIYDELHPDLANKLRNVYYSGELYESSREILDRRVRLETVPTGGKFPAMEIIHNFMIEQDFDNFKLDINYKYKTNRSGSFIDMLGQFIIHKWDCGDNDYIGVSKFDMRGYPSQSIGCVAMYIMWLQYLGIKYYRL